MKTTVNQDKKLKIAYVSDAIYPYNKGGKEKRLFEISTRLAARGHDVHIYCMKWWQGKKRIRLENNVTLHAISPLYPLYSGERRSIRQAIFFSIFSLILIKEDFDILDVDHMPHLILFPAKLACLLKGKKLYATWNEVWGRKYWIEYMGVLGNIAYLIEKFSVRLPNEIIVVSRHTDYKLKNELNVNKTTHIIPNGIDIEYIQKVKPAGEKSDIIYAGRLLKHKNVELLIYAIKELRNKNSLIKCIIIGNGPEKKKLQQLVFRLNLHKNITFYDFFINQEDSYSLVRSSKVFAFPSEREGFGIVALEALALGIPVVTSDHKDNATKDLIKSGKCVNLFNLKKGNLTEVLQNTLQVKRKSIDIKDAIKTYDWNMITNRIQEVYSN